MTADRVTLPEQSAAPAQRSGRKQRSGKHCALRPVIVLASLESLHGPVEGLVELPQRLFWSGTERVFDLSDRDRLAEMYEAVFDAARTETDLTEYLNGEVLARLWPELALAPRVRRAWQAVHWQLEPARCPSGTFADA
jgi:hypothetical protein